MHEAYLAYLTEDEKIKDSSFLFNSFRQIVSVLPLRGITS
jgi:hypothetical protein